MYFKSLNREIKSSTKSKMILLQKEARFVIPAVTYIKGGLKNVPFLGKGLLKPLQCTCTAHAAFASRTSRSHTRAAH